MVAAGHKPFRRASRLGHAGLSALLLCVAGAVREQRSQAGSELWHELAAAQSTDELARVRQLEAELAKAKADLRSIAEENARLQAALEGCRVQCSSIGQETVPDGAQATAQATALMELQGRALDLANESPAELRKTLADVWFSSSSKRKTAAAKLGELLERGDLPPEEVLATGAALRKAHGEEIDEVRHVVAEALKKMQETAELRALLQVGDKNRREWALSQIRELAERKRLRPSEVPANAAALRKAFAEDAEEIIRAKAAKSLGILAPQLPPEEVAATAAALRGALPENAQSALVRFYAADALGSLAPLLSQEEVPVTAAALREAADSEDATGRAADVLGALVPQVPAAATAFRKAVCLKAAEALGRRL